MGQTMRAMLEADKSATGLSQLAEDDIDLG